MTPATQKNPSIIRLLIFGTALVVMARAMSMPFLAIYLVRRTGLDAATIGLVIGTGALAGTFGGFIGGWLSDACGRSRILLGSILAAAAAFAGLHFAGTLWQMLLANVVIGLAAAFYDPVSKAMISDRLAPERRLRAFSHRYVAINVGFAIGPPLGAYLGLVEDAAAFLVTASVYLLFFLAVWVVARSDAAAPVGSMAHGAGRDAPRALQAIAGDRRLLLFTVGSTFALAVHGQMSVTFSQYLNAAFSDGVKMFAWLMSINAVTVVVSQPALRQIGEHKGALTAVVLGALGLSLGAIGFAQSPGFVWLAASMVVFTWGEVLLVPAEYSILDSITPERMRGAYYGAHSLSSAGNLLGPWLGGLALVHWGGAWLFYSMAAVALLSMGVFLAGSRLGSSAAQPVASVE